MREFDVFAGIITVLAVVALLAACLGIGWGSNWYTCDSKASVQGLEHQWGPFKGCLIKVDGRWIDYDKWRIME